MGASILWRPTDEGFLNLKVGAPSSFIESMNRAFHGEGRWKLDGRAIPILQGMAAASGYERDAYQGMIDAIEQHGSIEVWPEW